MKLIKKIPGVTPATGPGALILPNSVPSFFTTSKNSMHQSSLTLAISVDLSGPRPHMDGSGSVDITALHDDELVTCKAMPRQRRR